MKKVFISQPMADKTEEYMIAERKHLINVAQMYLKDEKVQIIDSFIKEEPPKNVNEGLWYLAKSLELMATADLVVFSREWYQFRGCRIEHSAAVSYGIDIIESYSDVKFDIVTGTEK